MLGTANNRHCSLIIIRRTKLQYFVAVVDEALYASLSNRPFGLMQPYLRVLRTALTWCYWDLTVALSADSLVLCPIELLIASGPSPKSTVCFRRVRFRGLYRFVAHSTIASTTSSAILIGFTATDKCNQN